jgi:hypothetical protein
VTLGSLPVKPFKNLTLEGIGMVRRGDSVPRGGIHHVPEKANSIIYFI